MPQANVGTASSRSSGRSDGESPTPGPRGDLAGRCLDATELDTLNVPTNIELWQGPFPRRNGNESNQALSRTHCMDNSTRN